MHLRFPKKLIKYNDKMRKYELVEITPKSYLENKKVLVLFPYPCIILFI